LSATQTDYQVIRTKDSGTVDFRLDLPDLSPEFSFLALGETGSGAGSQLVLAEKIRKEGAAAAFAVLAGNAAGPDGSWIHGAYEGDVFAVPGPDDWRDGLAGFRRQFCEGATATPTHRRSQPHMYFYLDTPHARLVFVDTGRRGRLGEEQSQWLERVSQEPKAKVMILGRPICANGSYDDNLAGVDRLIRDHHYCLVIAGGVRNFQCYRITALAAGRQRIVWHVVNGGAGAGLDRTDRIPPAPQMTLPTEVPLAEGKDFECYPTREQSAARFPPLLPNWTMDRNQPPLYKSFLRVEVTGSGLRVQLFAVEDFGPQWVEAPPYREWLIPYPEAVRVERVSRLRVVV